MNTKKFLMAALAVFVATFAADFLIHGVVLKGLYTETANLWRSEDECNMLFMIFSQLAFAAAFVFLFTRNYENKGIGEGVRFGLYIGLLLAALQVGTYAYMPIPLMLVFAWVLSALVKGFLAGVVTSSVYKS